MVSRQDRNWRALMQAMEVAIARGELEPKARLWGRVVLLEVMADVLGVPKTKLRNYYYRDSAKLEALLLDYAMSSSRAAIDLLQSLEFRSFSPLVWKRPVDQLAASRQSLDHTLTLLQMAERQMRSELDPPIELRREIGTVAAEIMACALTFFDGAKRWEILSQGDIIFRNAMGPLTLDQGIEAQDAPLFARFWENRATRCGLEWSNIWDDPDSPPTIGQDVVDLAIEELERATAWMRKFGGASDSDDDRVRQFAADKAKWYAKAGRFSEAREQIGHLGHGPGTEADRLLLQTLEQITSNSLDEAFRTGSRLAEILADSADSIAPVTSALMVHNIELMRGRRPPMTDEMTQFLRESPVAASEHVNLPRYRRRLADLGFSEAA